MELVFLFIGIAIGFLLAWFISKSVYSKPLVSNDEVERLKSEIQVLNNQNSKAEERNRIVSETLANKEKELSEERGKVVSLSAGLSKTTADFENLKVKLAEQKSELENLQLKFVKEFENLANKIFEEKGKTFALQNKTNLDEVLNPLKERIKEFEKKVEETYDKESKQRFSLEREIKSLVEANQKISKEANDLTNALKGQAKTLGNWGEVILESILQKSGLVKDREYFLQKSFIDEEGKRLQPDVLVNYPGGKSIIIDSKVSLLAYDRYSAAESKEEQQTALAEHLQSVRNHIIGLSKKNYQDIYEIKTLDFVMMFVPIEPAYMLAIQSDTELWNFAYDRRILLISPTNLIAALKMINSLWQQEYQNKYAMDIAKQAGALYDKFVGFVEDLITVGKKMDDAKSSYEGAMRKLHEGKGNLIRSVENIKELGAKASKVIPPALLERAD